MNGLSLRRHAAGVGMRLLILLFVLNYLMAAASIAAGDFDRIGLPAAMTTMEFWANLAEGLGWLWVFVSSLRLQRPGTAAFVCFLAGMFWFDVITTWPLDMPLPPGFLAWGSAVALLQLGVARWLQVPAATAASSVAPAWTIAVLLVTASAFAAYALMLTPQQLAAAGVPAIVSAPQRLALAGMALLAVIVAVAAWRGCHAARWPLYFLAGMWSWQMLTTALLAPWPGPPAQALWGPFSVALLLAAAPGFQTFTKE